MVDTPAILNSLNVDTTGGATGGTLGTIREFLNNQGVISSGTPGISNDFSYDKFPSDVASDYYGHYMTITAKVGSAPNGITTPTGTFGNAVGATPSISQYGVVMFIPSATSSSSLAYMDVHEYADVKLTNVTGAGAGGVLGIGGDPVSAASAVTAMGGYAINPGVQILYRSTKLRQFQFSFLMAPANEKESKSMESIIKTLRYYAAPETTGVFFKTPAEFDIKFFNKGTENTHIPRIRRCVLNRIDVDYTPLNGEWTTFTNGYPVSCIMTLMFQEMEIIHKQFIQDGY